MADRLGLYPLALLSCLANSEKALSVAAINQQLPEGLQEYTGRYQIAHRLESKGYLKSQELPSRTIRGGRRQKGYKITRVGRVALEYQLKILRELTES
jgi:DNA-binding PadR family transcriptional regulator